MSSEQMLVTAMAVYLSAEFIVSCLLLGLLLRIRSLRKAGRLPTYAQWPLLQPVLICLILSGVFSIIAWATWTAGNYKLDMIAANGAQAVDHIESFFVAMGIAGIFQPIGLSFEIIAAVLLSLRLLECVAGLQTAKSSITGKITDKNSGYPKQLRRITMGLAILMCIIVMAGGFVYSVKTLELSRSAQDAEAFNESEQIFLDWTLAVLFGSESAALCLLGVIYIGSFTMASVAMRSIFLDLSDYQLHRGSRSALQSRLFRVGSCSMSVFILCCGRAAVYGALSWDQIERRHRFWGFIFNNWWPIPLMHLLTNTLVSVLGVVGTMGGSVRAVMSRSTRRSRESLRERLVFAPEDNAQD